MNKINISVFKNKVRIFKILFANVQARSYRPYLEMKTKKKEITNKLMRGMIGLFEGP